MIYKLPYQGRWICKTDDEITSLKQSGVPNKIAAAQWFEQQYHDIYQKNPLAFFLAHSGAIPFLNDRTNQLCILKAGIQEGKTWALLAKLCLRGVPTSPDWPIYQFINTERGNEKYGKLIYHKWEGQGRMMMASYEWLHIRTNLWPKLCEILPVDELREYSPKWKSPMARRKYKTVSEHSPTCKVSCGTILDVFCYRSPPESFTSATYDRGAYLDEQSPIHVVKNVSDRIQNDPHGQLNESTTPHKIKGCDWTGKGGWLEKAWDGTDTLGMTVGRYELNRDEIPDAIISPEERATIYHKLITHPLSTGNQKAIREGQSKYYGTFESSEGLVYDNWIPGIHWIDQFEIPKHWTRFRAVDPGHTDTCAVLWAAMSPWGDCVLYRNYYVAGKGIDDNAKAIIEASGNQRFVAWIDNGVTNWEEKYGSEEYGFTVMDPRSFSQPSNETGVTRGQRWAQAGLRCIPASGKKNENSIPVVKEWLELIPGRKHILVQMKLRDEVMGPDGNKLTSAPRLYVQNHLHPFRNEIESYITKDEQPNLPADRQKDHDMTCFKYLMMANPRYLGAQQSQTEPTEPVPMTLKTILERNQPQSQKLYQYHF